MRNPRSEIRGHPWSAWREFFVIWPRKIDGVWCWFEWVETRSKYIYSTLDYGSVFTHQYRLIEGKRKLKACKDCKHCSVDLTCGLTAIYKTNTNYVTGSVEKILEYADWCFMFRRRPTILGGCGKRAKYFVLKNAKED